MSHLTRGFSETRGTAITLWYGWPMIGPQFMVGCDCNYFLEMQHTGHRWRRGESVESPLSILADSGCRWCRVRVFTDYDGVSGVAYAADTALLAQHVGMRPLVNLFLSDEWCTANHQPAPQAWRGLSLEERAAEARHHAGLVARHFKSLGIETPLFQVGNEIEYGLCGSYSESIRREHPTWMRHRGIWDEVAVLVGEAIRGVQEVSPEALFVLHVAHWFNTEFCIAFYRTVQEAGVDFDFLGSSYYPTSGIPQQHFAIGNSFSDLATFVGPLTDAIGKPLIIVETGYPSCEHFHGEFAGWTHTVHGYPLTLDGQRKWIAEFLEWSRKCDGVQGVFYWSPEFYSHANWSAFALFDKHGCARPGIDALC